MNSNRSGRMFPVLTGLMILTAIFLAGCAGSQIKSDDNAKSATEGQGSSSLYYDFGDVLVPSELKLEKSGSFVFRTPGLSAGVLSLKGRVEINSLIRFFDVNMAKDNWKLVSSFKSRRSIMLYHKENRWCVINITEEGFYTYAEIWVSPTTVDNSTGFPLDSGAGLLK